MTAKPFKWPAAVLGLAMVLSLGAGSSTGYAQDKGEKKEKINKAEEAAYKNVLAAQNGDPSARIQVGEDFVAKFPMSRYVGGVYGMLTTSYYVTGNTDKMFSTGAKALELNPDNVDVLALLAMAIPRRVKSTTPDGAQQLKNAETYGHHAIELIPNMVKPAAMDDATFEKQKNDELAMSHSGLGLLDLNRGKFEDAKTELDQAVKLASSPDPVDYYLLGKADAQGSYYNDAAAAFEKCAAAGPLMAQCKAGADSAKQDAATKLSR